MSDADTAKDEVKQKEEESKAAPDSAGPARTMTAAQ